MFGSFPPEVEEQFKADYLDFARCQRPNGTFYGTRGTCKRGTPAGDKELAKGKSGPAQSVDDVVGGIKKMSASDIDNLQGAVSSNLKKVKSPADKARIISELRDRYLEANDEEWGGKLDVMFHDEVGGMVGSRGLSQKVWDTYIDEYAS
jgi:hypothetical protein